MAGWWLVVARNGFGWLVVAFSLLFIACNALMAVNGCLITFEDMFCQLVFFDETRKRASVQLYFHDFPRKAIISSLLGLLASI